MQPMYPSPLLALLFSGVLNKWGNVLFLSTISVNPKALGRALKGKWRKLRLSINFVSPISINRIFVPVFIILGRLFSSFFSYGILQYELGIKTFSIMCYTNNTFEYVLRHIYQFYEIVDCALISKNELTVATFHTFIINFLIINTFCAYSLDYTQIGLMNIYIWGTRYVSVCCVLKS